MNIPLYLDTEFEESLWDVIKEKLKSTLGIIMTLTISLISSPELILTILNNLTVDISIKIAYLVFVILIILAVVYSFIRSLYLSFKYKITNI